MAFGTHHRQRPSRPSASPNRVAFQAFLERDALRAKRRRSRRNTLIVSLAVHAVAVLVLVVYSLWQVDELWTPSVPIKVYSQAAYQRALEGKPPLEKTAKAGAVAAPAASPPR
jgi:hypothetical protein